MSSRACGTLRVDNLNGYTYIDAERTSVGIRAGVGSHTPRVWEVLLRKSFSLSSTVPLSVLVLPVWRKSPFQPTRRFQTINLFNCPFARAHNPRVSRRIVGRDDGWMGALLAVGYSASRIPQEPTAYDTVEGGRTGERTAWIWQITLIAARGVSVLLLHDARLPSALRPRAHAVFGALRPCPHPAATYAVPLPSFRRYLHHAVPTRRSLVPSLWRRAPERRMCITVLVSRWLDRAPACMRLSAHVAVILPSWFHPRRAPPRCGWLPLPFADPLKKADLL